MANEAMGASLRQLRELFRGGTVTGLTDRQLLERYAGSRDGLAFEALVARHGPMVMATCRAILRQEQDVEDAFQATFLVLARKAGTIRMGGSLGGWLHRVAYRVALQARSQRKRRREREEAAMESSEMLADGTATTTGLDFDLRALLHEEIDRLPESQRLAVVLCDLEGLTYEQAAFRLHCTVAAFSHRLAKGRQRLRDRLIRRGLTASAVGVALTTARASAAVPASWTRAVVSAATGGGTTLAAVTLSRTIIKGMLMTQLKLAGTATLAALILGSLGVLATGAARSEKPQPAPAVGEAPPSDSKEPTEARVEAQGHAADPEENPVSIEGRIVDLEGRPVPDAQIKVQRLFVAKGDDLTSWLAEAVDRGVRFPFEGLIPLPISPMMTATTATDPDGRFQLNGIGQDRIVELLVSGPTVATSQIYAMSRKGSAARVPSHQGVMTNWITYHPRRFQYAAAPSKPIQGIIRDKDTGQPLGGVALKAAAFGPHSLIPAPGVEATTDAQGRYRLSGLPKAPAYHLFVEPGEGQPYPKGTFRAPADSPAFEPVMFDITLKRGVWIRGRVTDKATGEPADGYVNAFTFRGNPALKDFPGYDTLNNPAHAIIKDDGRYEIVGLPGRNLIVCRSEERRYRMSVGANAIQGYDPDSMSFPSTLPQNCNAGNYHVIAEIDVDPEAETATLDLQVDPGRTLTIQVIDPEGRPVSGTKAAGVTDMFPGNEYEQESSTVEVHALNPSKPRRVTVTQADRKLVGSVYLQGDEAGPLTLKLQPWGTITGRVIDEDGQPRAGLSFTSSVDLEPEHPELQGFLPGRIQIGSDGRFRVDGLVPGLQYGADIGKGFMFLDKLFREVTVQPGEVKDLGDLKVPLNRGDL